MAEKMERTLINTYLGAYTHATALPWRIYGSHSHRLLCDNYGDLRLDDSLDDMEVVKATKMQSRVIGDYWRIVVNDG